MPVTHVSLVPRPGRPVTVVDAAVTLESAIE